MSDIDALLREARKAGMEKEQIRNFLCSGYVPLPWTLPFHVACRDADVLGNPNEVGAGGARGGGKSVAMLAQIALDDCQRCDGLKCLMLRKIGRAIRESVEDMRLMLLSSTPHVYKRSAGVIEFPNRSRIVLGHYGNTSDIDAYLGLEYDVIGLEEATTLTAQKYRAIRTCNRTSKAGWRPRIYSNANPGGVGHAYYKKKFFGDSDTSIFISSTFRDNPFLDGDYKNVLDELVGWRRRAWRDGDWDLPFGEYFINFDTKTHVVSAPDVQEGCSVWLALDYGWTHPTCVLLFAEINGSIFVIDEYYGSGLLPAEHNEGILRMLGRNKIRRERVSRFVFGRDAYRKNEVGRTVVDYYEEEGWDNIVPANMNRIQGATRVLQLLGSACASPRLFICDTCPRLVETLQYLQHDPHRPEDVLKVDVNEDGLGGDDAYDALRYGILTDTGSLNYDTMSVPR